MSLLVIVVTNYKNDGGSSPLLVVHWGSLCNRKPHEKVSCSAQIPAIAAERPAADTNTFCSAIGSRHGGVGTGPICKSIEVDIQPSKSEIGYMSQLFAHNVLNNMYVITQAEWDMV